MWCGIVVYYQIFFGSMRCKDLEWKGRASVMVGAWQMVGWNATGEYLLNG